MDLYFATALIDTQYDALGRRVSFANNFLHTRPRWFLFDKSLRQVWPKAESSPIFFQGLRKIWFSSRVGTLVVVRTYVKVLRVVKSLGFVISSWRLCLRVFRGHVNTNDTGVLWYAIFVDKLYRNIRFGLSVFSTNYRDLTGIRVDSQINIIFFIVRGASIEFYASFLIVDTLKSWWQDLVEAELIIIFLSHRARGLGFTRFFGSLITRVILTDDNPIFRVLQFLRRGLLVGIFRQRIRRCIYLDWDINYFRCSVRIGNFKLCVFALARRIKNAFVIPGKLCIFWKFFFVTNS